MKRGAIVALVALVGSVLLPAPTGAQSSDDAKARLEDQLEDAEEVEAGLLTEYRAVQRRKAALDADVARLDTEVAQARVELEAAQARLAAAQAELAAMESALADVRAERDEAAAKLRSHAVASYVGNGFVDEVGMLMRQAESLDQLQVGMGYADYLVRFQQRAIEALRATEARVAAAVAALDGQREVAAAERDVVDGRRAELEVALAEQAALAAEAAAEVAREKVLLARAQAVRADYERRIAELSRTNETIRSALARRQAAQGSWKGGKLSSPLPGRAISSSFGWRVHPIYKTRRLHTGVDYSVAAGTPVRAAADGVVIIAGTQGGYGTAVAIDHGGSLGTVYAHLSRASVSVGQKVARGQVVGAVGSTGLSTGPHLHFEVRVKGDPRNPTAYF